MEQNDVPDNVVGAVETGDPPKNGTVWATCAYVTAEQAVDLALMLLDAAAHGRAADDPGWPPKGPVAGDDHDRRWRLHVHACSIRDSTFWVERTETGWRATEVETGVTAAEAPTARRAMENYFEGRLHRG